MISPSPKAKRRHDTLRNFTTPLSPEQCIKILHYHLTHELWEKYANQISIQVNVQQIDENTHQFNVDVHFRQTVVAVNGTLWSLGNNRTDVKIESYKTSLISRLPILFIPAGIIGAISGLTSNNYFLVVWGLMFGLGGYRASISNQQVVANSIYEAINTALKPEEYFEVFK